MCWSGGARAFPGRGWGGLGAIAAAAGLAQLDAAWAPSASSILAWWGLTVALDAAAWLRSGESALHDAPDAFVWMTVLSIFLGVGLEWAAVRLGAWSYLGLPGNEFLRYAVQGATFAAFVPALNGAALALGRAEPARLRPAPKWAGALRTAMGACLAAAVLAPFELLPESRFPMLSPGALLFGVWMFCSGANALRGRTDGGGIGQRWQAFAGLLLLFVAALITWLTGQGRYPSGLESPPPYEYLFLAALGPAMRAAYLFLADSLGLPAWPARENPTSLIR